MAQLNDEDRVTAILASPSVDDLELGRENDPRENPLDPMTWSEVSIQPYSEKIK